MRRFPIFWLIAGGLAVTGCTIFCPIHTDLGASATIELVGFVPKSPKGQHLKDPSQAFGEDITKALKGYKDQGLYKVIRYQNGEPNNFEIGKMVETDIGDELRAEVKKLFPQPPRQPGGLGAYTTRIGYYRRHQHTVYVGNKAWTTHNFAESNKAVEAVLTIIKKYDTSQ